MRRLVQFIEKKKFFLWLNWFDFESLKFENFYRKVCFSIIYLTYKIYK